MSIPKLYTVREASPMIRRSPSWIYREAKADRIPWTDLDGVFFTEEQIAQIIRDAARKPRTEKAQSSTGSKKAARQASTSRKAPPPPTTEIPQADPTISRLYRVGAA